MNQPSFCPITAPQAPAPVGLYPHARQVGPFLFLSGIGPRDPQTNQVPGLVLDEQGQRLSYDIEAECHAVFRNVKSVLDAAGATWEQLVDVTVFLIDIPRDFAAFNRIYGEYFQTCQPCRTTVQVTALPTPIAIELKCVAYLGPN